jgi:hypothetical protein
MRVLLDECVPRGLRAELPGHDVKTVAEAGWAGVENGALLQLAGAQFDVLLTVDRGLEYQQNFSGLTIAVVVVEAQSNDISVLRTFMQAVREALANAKPGTVTRVHGCALGHRLLHGISSPFGDIRGLQICERSGGGKAFCGNPVAHAKLSSRRR